MKDTDLLIENNMQPILVFLRWPIKDMKPQLFILGNLNGKTYYFTFGVLFSDLSFFPLLKPKFFFKFYFKTFFKTQIFSTLRVFFKKNLDVFKTQGVFFFKTQIFFQSRFFFLKTKFFIV